MSLGMGMTGGGSGGGGGGAGGVAAFCDVFVVLGLGTLALGVGHLENTNTDGTTLSLRRVVCPVRSKSSVLK